MWWYGGGDGGDGDGSSSSAHGFLLKNWNPIFVLFIEREWEKERDRDIYAKILSQMQVKQKSKKEKKTTLTKKLLIDKTSSKIKCTMFTSIFQLW